MDLLDVMPAISATNEELQKDSVCGTKFNLVTGLELTVGCALVRAIGGEREHVQLAELALAVHSGEGGKARGEF